MRPGGARIARGLWGSKRRGFEPHKWRNLVVALFVHGDTRPCSNASFLLASTRSCRRGEGLAFVLQLLRFARSGDHGEIGLPKTNHNHCITSTLGPLGSAAQGIST